VRLAKNFLKFSRKYFFANNYFHISLKIRFLRRLEQALKERDRIHTSDSCNDNESDVMDSPKASSPLLSTSSANKQKATNFKISRQKRVSNVYSFEPERKETLADLMSD
jgi:hypothetical protein